MKLNREKLVCCIALLFFLGGMYTVVNSFIHPEKDRPLPGIAIPAAKSKVFAPKAKSYLSSEAGGRNPFSFSEGWKDLDAVPLSPPSIPAYARILPGLSGGIPSEDGGVNFSEQRPKQLDSAPARVPGAVPGTTPGIVPGAGTAPGRGLLEVPGAGATKPAPKAPGAQR